jgi:plasmid stabilization system protein ParE
VAESLVRTSKFLPDYREVALGIGEENPQAANRFCDAVEAALDPLARHPQAGRRAGFMSAPRVHRWILQPFPNFVIYTRIVPARFSWCGYFMEREMLRRFFGSNYKVRAVLPL